MASRLTVLTAPEGRKGLATSGWRVPTLRAMPEIAFSYLAVGRSIVLYQAELSNDPFGEPR